MSNNFEYELVSNLMADEIFARKALPHIEPDYFREPEAKTLFEIVAKHFDKHKSLISKREAKIEVQGLVGTVSDDLITSSMEKLRDFDVTSPLAFDWVVEKTEKFCRQRALYNAAAKTLAILNGQEKKLSEDAVPDLFKDALAVGFDTRVGHDYLEEAGERWDFYNQDLTRLPFKIEEFNKITGGGLPSKTLTIPVAGTNVGKSLLLCDWAADWLTVGKNVLYISLEMARERVAERIDANLLKVAVADLKNLPKDHFVGEVAKTKKNTHGRLMIEEFPTRSASVRHFRKLLRDLEIKKNFKPDVILIDYLNIVAAAGVKQDSGMYQYVKVIAEELRGLAMEYDVPIIAPTQTNRTGQNHSDVTLEEVAESHGTNQTADFIFAMIRTDKLRESNKILIKQLKNRFGDVGYITKFVIGVDMPRMTLYQLDREDQMEEGVRDTKPVFDHGKMASEMGLDFGSSEGFDFR